MIKKYYKRQTSEVKVFEFKLGKLLGGYKSEISASSSSDKSVIRSVIEAEPRIVITTLCDSKSAITAKGTCNKIKVQNKVL